MIVIGGWATADCWIWNPCSIISNISVTMTGWSRLNSTSPRNQTTQVIMIRVTRTLHPGILTWNLQINLFEKEHHLQNLVQTSIFWLPLVSILIFWGELDVTDLWWLVLQPPVFFHPLVNMGFLKPKVQSEHKMSTKTNPVTFHWVLIVFLRILIMVDYNPYING